MCRSVVGYAVSSIAIYPCHGICMTSFTRNRGYLKCMRISNARLVFLSDQSPKTFIRSVHAADKTCRGCVAIMKTAQQMTLIQQVVVIASAYSRFFADGHPVKALRRRLVGFARTLANLAVCSKAYSDLNLLLMMRNIFFFFCLKLIVL